MNNILSKLSAARLVLMTLLFGSALTAHAEETVYISDFGIKAGERMEIAINFDADASGFKYLEGNIQLPAGLKLIEDAYGKNLRARCDETRAKGGMANMNPATGDVIIASSGKFSGTKGAVGYITVESTRYLKEVSKINLSGFKAVKEDGSEVRIPNFVTTVTRTTPLAWLKFVKDSQVMKAGETVDVEVEMTNVVDISFVQANLTVSDGLKIVEVKPTDRVKGVSHNNTDVYIFSGVDTYKKGGIVTGKGTIFTITVAADKNFSGNAWVYVKKTVATDGEAVTYKPADLALPVTVEAAFEPLFADGKYYFQETATGKFLAAGNSWGTQAIVNEDGLDYTVAITPEGKYTLDSRVSNGGNNHFLNADPLYNDQPAYGWTIAKTADGAYTLSNGTKFVALDEANNLVFIDEAEKAAQWKLMTYEERYKTLAAATKQKPVDATFTVHDAGFNRNDQRVSAWTGDGFSVNGDPTNTNAEKWGGNSQTFDIHQTVEVPNGIYKITWNGFYRFNNTGDNTNDIAVAAHADGTEVINSFVYVNDQDFALTSIADDAASEALEGKIPFSQGDASAAFGKGLYAQSADVIVTDGKLTLGIKKTNHPGTDWTVWDNFRVTYLGPDYPIESDTYYIQHVATGKFLAAGHDWGTRAIVNNDGLDYITTLTPEGKYTFDSQVSNGGNSHFLNPNPLYNDQGAFGWTVEKAANGGFTISNGSELLTVDADDNCALTTENGENAIWKFVTYEERLKSLDEATKQNPVNATFIVKDANFGRNDLRKSAWTETHEGIGFSFAGGDNTNMAAEAYVATYDLRQTITGLPNGIYKVEAQGAVTFHDDRVIKEYDGNGYPVIFANEKTSNFNEMVEADRLTNMNQICQQFMAGLYEVEPIEVEVTDGTLTVGTKSDRADIWAMWDNFRVTYLGSASAPDEPVKEAPTGWTLAVTNGNLAGDDVSSYVAKEAPSADILPARIVAGAGKDGSRGIVVNSADNPGQAWDTQFWIVLNEKLPQGSKLHVEFDYKASKAAKASTQAHGAPGAYQHWAAIGDVNFTTEWQHFSKDIEVDGDMATANGGTGLLSIAFNMAEEKTATEYCLDNFGVWYQKPAPVQEWKDIITNGSMEGSDVVNFFKTEATVGPVLAEITDGIGKDGGRAIKVQSADNPSQNWDTQFFIRLPFELAAGTKFKISFDYKADKDGATETQSHNEPGQYIHWACCGSPSFTTAWQHYEYEGTVASQCDGTQADGGFLKNFQTIAINLALNKVATAFIFDNVKFEVEKSVWETGIRTVNTTVKANDGAIYDLRGRKVEGALRKGVYIQNGRKIMVK